MYLHGHTWLKIYIYIYRYENHLKSKLKIKDIQNLKISYQLFFYFSGQNLHNISVLLTL